MDRIDRSQFDDHEPLRSAFQAGLAQTFAPCHEPVPGKMERLIDDLRKREPDRAPAGPAQSFVRWLNTERSH
jgi:hypothetical protein